MKTGLVTFYHIHHYGALLQAAATQRAVESLGAECEIIDYYVNQKNALFRKPTGLGSLAADTHTALHYKALETRYQRFEKFSKDHLRISGHRFESLEELRHAELPYDLILSGSDQIWNPKIFPDGHFDPVFFGAFSDRRKIAYAPSFGIPAIPEEMETELRDYLKDFSHVSARETQGREILREITGKDFPVVLDPTLLLNADQWAAMANTPRGYPGTETNTPQGYILCYCISKPGALEPYIRQLAERTGLPVVQLCGIRRKVHPKARCILDAGPAEFLALFQNASYVCTNSFHGTVFSVQFQKPFFTAVAPSELAAPERSRTFSILSRLGLTDRIIGKGDTADLETEIDWAGASERLAEARKSSLAYLRAALENEQYATEIIAPQKVQGDFPVLAEHGTCTGCTACASGCPKDAITMERDKEGFAYPVIDPDKCVRCGHCTAVCPMLHERNAMHLPAAFAAWNRDDQIRKDSTSGGVFTALAEYVLEGGGVVYGAAMDGRQHLRHIACFRKEDLWRLRGAKYVQSDLGETFREIREALKVRPVLFSGTPCQVDGLYRFLGSRPENLTTCDLVCHGVPSPGVWEDMARSIEQRKGKGLQAVRFRNKVTGWKDSHFTTVYDDGTVDTAPLFATEYGRAFGRALFLRPSCHCCAYTNLNRPGDFTLGDFWGLRPDELPEQQEKGVNLLLVNTAHGSHIFDQLPLSRQAFPVERAVAGNPRLASPIQQPADRAAFFAAYALEPFDRVRKRFCGLPPLPVRAAGKLLSPELKAKIRSKLK
ncbi:polysaccharide pyruvyl transferase family protein [Oscillibacter valericigenes]|uniref:polysaccharide pyruvyl transferase family protein n=1 Tax=Oscillibacter valericigenes TaxID=351091 RepID=UPI001F204D00|nr:polysaccharide pyruvyl transferase family protein [Oscillibacter valericigenes]MCF2663539.1 polysaccharide pyruvyl transferase family protein [Oscillibacter valericigenes]